MCFKFHSAVNVGLPMVKCKTRDITDVNNYRAIAVSNAITKILEDLLFNLAISDSIGRTVFSASLFAVARPSVVCLSSVCRL